MEGRVEGRRGSTTSPRPDRRSSLSRSPQPNQVKGGANDPGLQALEEQLRTQIESAFFEDDETFKPFSQVIEILAIALDTESGSDGSGSNAAEELEGNPLYENVQRQLSLCSEVVEKITVEHHSSLNSSVQAMGGVARHYDQTRRNVSRLREQVKECKSLLQSGAGQSDIKELWQRRRQHAHVLHLLDQLDLLRDAPACFDRLVRQKRFVAAVVLLNGALDAIFSPDLVDVPAIAGVRDELLGRKETLLERLVREVSDALFLRTAVGLRGNLERAIQGSANAGGGGGGGRRRRRGGGGRRQRGGDWDGRSAASGSTLLSDDAAPASAPVRSGGGGLAKARSNTEADDGLGGGRYGGRSGGARRIEAWAGLRMDLTPVDEASERAMEDPSNEFGVYMRLLMESVRRLRNVDDAERYLMERLQEEVEALSASHMRACVAGRALPAGGDVTVTLGGIAVEGPGIGGASATWQGQQDAARLTQYLRLAFDAFMRVVRHCIYFVKLTHEAKLRNLRESADSAAAAGGGSGATSAAASIYDYEAPYNDALVRAVWAHMQRHLRAVLDRHILDPVAAVAPGGGVGGGMSPMAQQGRAGITGDNNIFNRMAAQARQQVMKGAAGIIGTGRGEPGALFASTMGELDRDQNAEFCRTCVLAPQSPLAIISVFLPTLRFVEAGQAALRQLRKELNDAATQRRNAGGGGSSGSDGGEDPDAASLAEFLSQAVQERLLPCIMRDSNAAYARICDDPDAFFPSWGGGAGAGASAGKAAAAAAAGGGGAGSGKAGEAAAAAAGGGAAAVVARPNKAAQVLYAQAKPIFRAVLQIPTYMEKVSAVLEITLDNFLSASRNKFGEFTAGSCARERLDRCGDRLRDLLQRDAQYLRYKRVVYGGRLPSELKIGPAEHSSPARQRSGANSARKTVGNRLAAGLGLGAASRLDPEAAGAAGGALGHRTSPTAGDGMPSGVASGTSAEEEADDAFESEFMLLRELWQFDAQPFPVIRKGLISLRHQQAIASLAYSCDWIAHRVLRMHATLQAEQRASTNARGGPTSASGPASSSATAAAKQPGVAQRGWGRSSPNRDNAAEEPQKPSSTPAERLLEVGRRLSALSDDCLLVLRLELMVLASLHMQQVPSIELDVERGKAGTTAMSLGRVEDACVVELSRTMRDTQEAVSPIDPKAHVGLIAPRELFAFVVSPVPRLLPRLLVHAMRYAGQGRIVTIGGVGKLNKILSTLQQTVLDVTETSRGCLPGGSGGLTLTDVISERFARAGRYVALMSMPQDELEAYIRLNRTEFSKEEYRVQWVLAGPNRRVGPEAGSQFDMWWASTY